MNDEEIMKKFNETFSDEKIEQEKEEQTPVTPYRATTNTSSIAPNSNLASNNQMPNSNIPSLNEKEVQSADNYQDNVNYSYVETPVKKEKKTLSIKLSQELLSAIILVLLLLMAIMIIPTIYDHFTGV